MKSELFEEVVPLLQELIAIESISRQEDGTADAIAAFLDAKGISVNRTLNNVWARNYYYDPKKPTILLNSHHDTVKPNASYTRNPFSPDIVDDKLYGLGSNDAGGALVSLLSAFLHFYKQEHLRFNLIFAATAEEEISGKNGVELILPELGPVALGVVGEPTTMGVAIAEKGLMVLDCKSRGKAGHAARDEGENAIYKAIKDIEWFRTYSFPKVSELLGPVKMTTSVIQAGSQHNVVPDTCNFTVDIRVSELYTHHEVLDIIKKHTTCDIDVRSFRLQSSAISITHPIVQAGLSLGLKTYGSPTTSDQALMNFPTIKIGPGNSERSHTADEFIYLYEIDEGITTYINLLSTIL